jgi:quaternary ammonium compound-resistance protein SugE
MAWVYLFTAALFEIGWAIGLKYTQGFTKPWPSLLTITAMVISLTFLALAVRTIPVGTG